MNETIGIVETSRNKIIVKVLKRIYRRIQMKSVFLIQKSNKNRMTVKNLARSHAFEEAAQLVEREINAFERKE